MNAGTESYSGAVNGCLFGADPGLNRNGTSRLAHVRGRWIEFSAGSKAAPQHLDIDDARVEWHSAHFWGKLLRECLSQAFDLPHRRAAGATLAATDRPHPELRLTISPASRGVIHFVFATLQRSEEEVGTTARVSRVTSMIACQQRSDDVPHLPLRTSANSIVV